MASALEGFAELDRQLRALPSAVQGKVLRAAVRQALEPITRLAQHSVPVGSKAHRTYKGRLVAPGFAARSLRRVVKGQGGAVAIGMVGVRSEAFYALQFIELGTSRIPATPWLVPAFERSRNDQIKRLGEALEAGIRKAAGK